MSETYKTIGLRKVLVKTLQDKGIKDEFVLKAIGKVPRHLFASKYTPDVSYQDKALKIDAGQTISQPYTVAYQSELLHVRTGDKVLEIGTGSGYQSAILLELGANLFTIERQEELYKKAKTQLTDMGYKAKFFCGDGSKGLEKHAPFQKIIVTAGAPVVPDSLLKQLSIGGILVIPVGDATIQKMITILKVSEKEYEKVVFDSFKFVPLVGEKAW